MVRVSDVLQGGSQRCRRCADKRTSQILMQRPEFHAQLRRAALKGASIKLGRQIVSKECTSLEIRYIRKIGNGAKARCTQVSNDTYADYGGRGIQFRFASPVDFAWWVFNNLGHRPAVGYSIDRIDNDGHYEPGNLRWASRSEQARNKRAYKGNVYGYRLSKLCAARPDYTYEGLRKFIKLGWTDEQIINHKKGSHVNPSLRYSKLRAEAPLHGERKTNT